ncbi:aldose 1-epimerase [Spirochaetia bacterium]|nr:aldose 1-epimerase [Spirochaetia bacterium]
MKVSKKNFGLLSNGEKAYLYTLKAGDLSMSITSFGATWTSLLVPSKNGQQDDVLLGYSSLAGYCNNKPFLGATVGRFANRIKGAAFTLEGRRYTLDKNNGENTLHSGRRGFDKLLWKAETYKEKDGVFVRFELESPDGDGGFPGALKAAVSYGLTKSNEVIASYEARVNAPSPINLTNHSYFNLAGEGDGDILSHEAVLYASSYVEIDRQMIPTGKLLPVQGASGTAGPFDFLKRKPIGRDIAATVIGYDHCYALDGEIGKLRPCAEIFEPRSGRSMKVFTTQPGVQFYTGNSLDGLQGKAGSVYNKHGGFCLETQHFPDSPNQPSFPSAIFGPGKNYHEKAVFSFDW